MSSVSAEGSAQKELKTGSGSSQEVPCCHAEIEFKMSVTISRAWADAFKRPDSGDCFKDVLKKVVSEATKKNHNVSIITSDGTSRLEGCFCGIKEIRTALQNAIRKEQTQENGGKLFSDKGAVDLGNDQQSHQENDKMETTDLRGIKPIAPKVNATVGKVEQSESGNRSNDQRRNNEKLEFQRDIKDAMMSGPADSNSENSNTAKTEEKRQRTVIEKSPEVKSIQRGVTNSGNSEGRGELEGNSKDVKSSNNLMQQPMYPDLSKVRSDDYSESPKQFIGKSQEVKVPRNENTDVTNSHKSERRDDLKKEGASKDGKYSENPKQQEVKVIKNENKGLTDSHHSERRDDLKKKGDVKYYETPKQQVRPQDSTNSKNEDYKENLKYDAKNPKSTNSFGLQENKTNDQEHDRICALMLLPSVDIDEDIFHFLMRHRNHELSRISEKCNLVEQYKEGKKQKLAFDVKPFHDTDSVIAEFRKLYDQIAFDNVKIPEGIDPESLKSLVESMAEFKDVEVRFISQERVCNIVGSYREMARAKEMLLDVIYPDRPTSHGFDTTANKKAYLNVQFPATPTHTEPTRTAQLYTATAAINISPARMSVYTVLNQDNNSVLLSVSNSLTIEVKLDDLTKMSNVDVVVSCINYQLDVDGFVADEIMRAAGPGVKTELLSHKHRLSSLRTGCLVHTSAGYLKGVKAIVHVVRPQDHRSTDDLRKVFTNCLSYTNDVLRMKSICLPPIGFLLCGAQMVVDSFLDAVDTFASTVANGNPSAAAQHQHNTHHLNYIQLVTNDHHCIGQLIHFIRRRLGAC